MKRLVLLALAVLVLVPGAMARDSGGAPVIKYRDDQFGPILATPKKKALYYWTSRSAPAARCAAGRCAQSVAAADRQEPARRPEEDRRHSGAFGVVKRPNGRLLVTHRGLPVYTYAHERPEQVLCDNVDGWFVVRLR